MKFLLVAVAAIVCMPAVAAQIQLCAGKTVKTDIILVVDRSSSIEDDDFLSLKTDLSNLVGAGLRATNTTRVALISYATYTTLEFSFDDEVDPETATVKIRAMRRNGERFTFTYDALTMARDVLIPQTREDANVYIVVFTDGVSNGMVGATAHTIEVANQIKQLRPVKVMTIGVGHNVNLDELKGISSDGQMNSTTFQIMDYSLLTDLIKNYLIKNTICNQKKLPPPKLPCRDGMSVTEVIIVAQEDADPLVLDDIETSLKTSLDNPAVTFSSADVGNLAGYLQNLTKTADGYPIAYKLVIAVIDKNLDQMTGFTSSLTQLADQKTIIIPMDTAGMNGEYERRKLALAGGYKGTECLFCGGLRKFSLHFCGLELADFLQC